MSGLGAFRTALWGETAGWTRHLLCFWTLMKKNPPKWSGNCISILKTAKRSRITGAESENNSGVLKSLVWAGKQAGRSRSPFRSEQGFHSLLVGFGWDTPSLVSLFWKFSKKCYFWKWKLSTFWFSKMSRGVGGDMLWRHNSSRIKWLSLLSSSFSAIHFIRNLHNASWRMQVENFSIGNHQSASWWKMDKFVYVVTRFEWLLMRAFRAATHPQYKQNVFSYIFSWIL